ncbi:BQ2448_3443 [Microbotryum intermedium]|uniref:BQ2448_3443 protein n=1 Tax=Microbotryum intermedium TaxID=269621 RepID=A0A238FEZ8_9BASI|nr:BQ2448_3443 [Microbotryum intermedium]
MKPRLPALIAPPRAPGGAEGAGGGSTNSPRRTMASLCHAWIAIARSHSKFTCFKIVVCVALTVTFIVFVPSTHIIQRVGSRVEAELAPRTAQVGRRPWALDTTSTIPDHEDENQDRPQLRQDKQSADVIEGEDETSRSSSPPPSELDKTVDRPLSENEKPSRCKRTLLFKMAGLHGFGSEVLMLARMAVLADMLDYSLLIDSSKWNYGPWESIFQTPALDCEPPPSTTRRGRIRFDRKARMLDEAAIRKSWATVNHVVWSTRDNAGLDRALVDMLTSASEMDSLHKRDLEQMAADRAGLTTPGPKLASQLVPSALQAVFTRQSQSFLNLWSLSRPAAVCVQSARANLSPLIQKLLVAQQMDGEASPIVIGMHLRLGDKCKEINKIGPQALKNGLGRRSTLPEATPTKTSKLDDRSIKKYLTAATTLVERIRRGDVDALLDVSLDERPVLLVASDSPTASSAFAKHKLGRAFNVIDIADLERSEAAAPNESPQGEDRMLTAENGFEESKFNKLPLEGRERVALGFVCDITILDQVSHGLVMSASSNVGRMLALLGGEQKIKQGLIASVDTR